MENNEKTTVTVWLKNGMVIVERVCFNREAEEDPAAIKKRFSDHLLFDGAKKENAFIRVGALLVKASDIVAYKIELEAETNV